MCDYGKENILKDIEKIPLILLFCTNTTTKAATRGAKNVKYKIVLI